MVAIVVGLSISWWCLVVAGGVRVLVRRRELRVVLGWLRGRVLRVAILRVSVIAVLSAVLVVAVLGWLRCRVLGVGVLSVAVLSGWLRLVSRKSGRRREAGLDGCRYYLGLC